MLKIEINNISLIQKQLELPGKGLDIKSRAVNGVRWTVLTTVVTTVLQFVKLAVLGRLLEPAVFGLMALVYIVVGFAQLFSQMGLSEALIQRKKITHEQLSSLYWLNIAFGCVVFLILWACTPILAKAFGELELNQILPVTSISFLITPFGTQFKALLQKSLHFHLLSIVQIISSMVSVVVAIVSAWLGQGVWSLVWGSLSGTITNTVMLMAYGWHKSVRPRFHFRWADIDGYLSFGLYRVGASSINFFNSRIDQLLIGTLLGTQALGYYSMAFQLVLQPIQKLNPVLTQVAFPVFSQIQDDIPRQKRGYFTLIRLLMFVNAPILLGLAGVAPLLVPLLFGAEWKAAVPLIQILSIYALIRSLGNAGGSLIMGRGRADWTFYWNSVLLIVIAPTIYLASLSGSVIYIALSLAMLQSLLFIAHYRVFIHNLLGPCFIQYIKAIGIPIVLAGVMNLLIIGIDPLFQNFPELAHFMAQVVVGFFSYVLLLWLFQREYIKTLRIYFTEHR